jgi:hypothetical protein
MEKQKSNRSRIIGIRLTPQELAKINGLFKETTSRKLSDYVRNVLLNGKVTIQTRDRSLDDCMAELIEARRQLQASGNNLNQAVKRLHTLKTTKEILEWLPVYERLVEDYFQKLDEIKCASINSLKNGSQDKTGNEHCQNPQLQ